MFNIELINAVESFASLTQRLTEKELEHEWVWKDHDEEGIRFAFFVTIQELRQLAVQITANRKLTTQAQHILGQYHKQYMDLQASVFGLSKEDSEHKPAENEWPVVQIYAHILGAEIGFSGVVSYALEGHRSSHWRPERMSDDDETRIIGMNEDGYKTLMRGSLPDLLVFHREFHRGVIDKFRSISDAELDLPSSFWEETRFPIRHRLHRYEAHIIQH
ncbi:MAG TPA: DinB family protein, partial [Anaerolineales bacterium]|nr:DinB family protein [Anaerolineales bacterium]